MHSNETETWKCRNLVSNSDDRSKVQIKLREIHVYAL